MIYQWLADLVVLFHFAFIVFVIIGGFFAIKWPKLIYLHIPAALWGVLIEFSGWICPLTPLENWLRRSGGQATYDISFIDRYITPIIYPQDLTRQDQFIYGVLVIVINTVAYGILLWRSINKQNNSK